MDNLSGQQIKGYELRELIGVGGFGAVYLAYQPQVRREVAIKVILPEYVNHPEFIRRFEAEAQLVARLEHIHIVPLYDYWREPNGAYLVMRWLRGGSLRKSLENGPLETSDAIRMVDQIASALAVAHRNGVIHRDLKPDNILLDEDKNAFLADFGIAKDLENVASMAQSEEEEGVVGSPAYLSPEQIRGMPVSAQTDIYSMGILLYEILTGRTPFHGLPTSTQFIKHLNDPIPFLAEARPGLPEELDMVIQRATAKSPEDRYPNILHLAADFRRVMVMENTEASTDADQIMIADLAKLGITEEFVTAHLPGLEPVNPYKGLRAFQEADADDFFGRETLVERLLERMQDGETWSRFLAVVGPSGSGKSSVVKAGVIPALRRGKIEGSENWFIVEMVPGTHPLEELESALLRIAVNPLDDLLKQMRQDKDGLLKLVERALPDASNSELVLLIDQFEELFTQVEDESERAHFLNSLMLATTDPASRLRVLATLRADFYDRPLLYPRFGELVRSRTEVVLPLSSEELERAITEPAERNGLALEVGLVTAIVADVGEQPGALPLLQYALTELFERRDGRWLTLNAYNDIGGVSGALARRASEIYQELSPEGQRAARQMFLRLVTLGEGTEDTRRRVHQSDLLSLEGSEQAMNEVITLFGKYRLLTFDRDPATRTPTVEVAHEALIRQWMLLRQWLADSREDLRLQQRLSAATEEWLNSNKETSFLLSGMRLQQFEEWSAETEMALTEQESEYLKMSLAERERERAEEAARLAHEAALERRSRNRLRALAVVMAVAAVVALFLWRDAVAAREATEVQRKVAEEQAQIALARQLAAQARGRLNDDRPDMDLALLLSVESDRIASSLDRENMPEIRSVLFEAVNLNPLRSTFLLGHRDRLRSLVFSANSTRLASVGIDGTVILWDSVSGRQVALLSGQTYGVRSAAFSPDNIYLVTGSWDGTVNLWDAVGGLQIAVLLEHSRGVEFITFTSDSKLMATGSWDGTINVWDMATRQLTTSLQGYGERLRSLAFSPNGKWLAAGGDNGFVAVWEMPSGKLHNTLTGHRAEVRSLVFTPDSQRLATGDWTGRLRIWDVASGRPIANLPGHQRGIQQMAFNSAGDILVSESWDGEIREWKTATGEPPRILNTPGAKTNTAIFSPDTSLIGLGDADGTVVLVDMVNNLRTVPLRRHNDLVNVLAFSPDHELLASGSLDGTIIVWNAADRLRNTPLSGHTDVVNTAAFSPDGRQIASGGFDSQVIVWDVSTRQKVAALDNHQSVVLDVAFSPDNRWLASGGWDGAITLWDRSKNYAPATLTGHRGGVNTIVFSPDSRTLASGSDDGTIILWDVASGAARTTLEGHTGWVNVIAFSPDGKHLASGSADGRVVLWDVTKGTQQAVLAGHNSAILSVVFSPNGKYIASGSFDKTAILWDAATGSALATLRGHESSVLSLAFSPDSKTLASGSDDGMALLWNVPAGTIRARLSEHTGGVNTVAFNPEGEMLATGGWDNTVMLWDTATGERIARLIQQTGGINVVTFNAQGDFLASGSDDGTVMLWDVSADSWKTRACRTANRNMTDEEWRRFMGSLPYHETCPNLS